MFTDFLYLFNFSGRVHRIDQDEADFPLERPVNAMDCPRIIEVIRFFPKNPLISGSIW